jgi:hypothetical protein
MITHSTDACRRKSAVEVCGFCIIDWLVFPMIYVISNGKHYVQKFISCFLLSWRAHSCSFSSSFSLFVRVYFHVLFPFHILIPDEFRLDKVFEKYSCSPRSVCWLDLLLCSKSLSILQSYALFLDSSNFVHISDKFPFIWTARSKLLIISWMRN